MVTPSNTTTIGVVGAGTMGRGIVQLFLQAGHMVRCHDAQPGAAAKAVEYVDGMLARAVEKGRMTAADQRAARGRRQPRHARVLVPPPAESQ